MKTAQSLRNDLAFVEMGVQSIMQDLDRFDPNGEKPLGLDGAKEVVRRIGNLEALLNQVKVCADDMKREALRNR